MPALAEHLLTLRERSGTLDGLRLAYVGDGQQRGRLADGAGCEGRRARGGGHARELAPDPLVAQVAGGGSAGAERATLSTLQLRPRARAAVYTDVWFSIGDDEGDGAARPADPFRLDDALLAVGAGRRRRAALPSRPSRRGDLGRGAVRASLCGVGPGGESAPCQKALMEMLSARCSAPHH